MERVPDGVPDIGLGPGAGTLDVNGYVPISVPPDSARAFAGPCCGFNIGDQGFEDEGAGPEPGSGGFHEPCAGPGISALPI